MYGENRARDIGVLYFVAFNRELWPGKVITYTQIEKRLGYEIVFLYDNTLKPLMLRARN